MTGPERTPHSNARFDPIAHVVLEPYSAPGTLKPTKSKSNAPQPPRPQNAWILYRAWALNGLLERQPELKGTPQSQLSKILGTQWANETPEVRKHFEHQANLNKERHAQEFPDYVFKPQKKEEKEKEREEKKKQKARVREAEKLKKEIEKALRAGRVPPSMMGMPANALEGGLETQLQNLAVCNFGDLGPSPPMSKCPSLCPSPVIGAASVSNESHNSESHVEGASPTTDSSVLDGGVSTECTTVSDASKSPDSGVDESTQQNVTVPSSSDTPCPPNQSMVVDASQAPSSSFIDAIDWSHFEKGNMGGLEAFIHHAFPPGVPGPLEDRFEMPSGNIIVAPGFVEGSSQSNDFNASGLVSIPLDDMAGMIDDQYNCDLTNPHAEQDSSSASNSNTEQPNEAIFMQPFVQLDVSLEHLLSAGKEVGDALLDEREASANGERVMASQHLQNGVPAKSVAKPGASAFLPSPPESSAEMTSPLTTGTFDFGSATNLCASGSNQQTFGGLGFSDSMPNTDASSLTWGLPPFDGFGVPDSLGLGSSSGLPSITTELPANIGDCTSNLQSSLFSSIPTPISAGPWLGGSFDIGEIQMADFSSSIPIASALGQTQKQKEDDWFASCFNESGTT